MPGPVRLGPGVQARRESVVLDGRFRGATVRGSGFVERGRRPLRRVVVVVVVVVLVRDRNDVAGRAHERRKGTRQAPREGFVGLFDRRRRMVGRILRAVRDRAGKDRRLELLRASAVQLVWNELRSSERLPRLGNSLGKTFLNFLISFGILLSSRSARGTITRYRWRTRLLARRAAMMIRT